jgi:hypothetical protein
VSERANAIFDVVPIISAIAAVLLAFAAFIHWRMGRSVLTAIKKGSRRRPAHLVTPTAGVYSYSEITARRERTVESEQEKRERGPGAP